ncbi:non-homologous end-joining DNA ligase [Dyella sp.]|uniref:non-homologous end-joining DNA ligase n=1 Tax=Dyella sp. TaxID=1869338 RepID=UPI002846B8FB|nr:non-homologous end-joining DNA ligase [Dyella sp.]MDR3446622.1 non-homologous end-joining DNA ligase [Dyella sp.]
MTITSRPGPVVTHLQRLVFPADDITKQDIANYYQAVMPRFLPGIAGRPTSVYRFPEGTTKSGFFQKHPMRGPQHVEHITLREESGAMDDYICPGDAGAVIELVQYNAIEFHPWASRATSLEEPDYLVFDLDPGDGISWPEVTDAARWIRGRLVEASLQSFVRTTGGKGLHVVVPLHTSCRWDDARQFSNAFAHGLADEQPASFTAKASKAERKGRIFIDYLRNTRGATSVASWSLRARPGAPVAMPMRWQDLGRCASGDAFDIRSARRRLSRLRSEPWEGFATMRQSLEKPLRIYAPSKA